MRAETKLKKVDFLSKQHPLEQHATFNLAAHFIFCKQILRKLQKMYPLIQMCHFYANHYILNNILKKKRQTKLLSPPSTTTSLSIKQDFMFSGLHVSSSLTTHFPQCELIMRQAVIKMFALIVHRVIRCGL